MEEELEIVKFINLVTDPSEQTMIIVKLMRERKVMKKEAKTDVGH